MNAVTSTVRHINSVQHLGCLLVLSSKCTDLIIQDLYSFSVQYKLQRKEILQRCCMEGIFGKQWLRFGFFFRKLKWIGCLVGAASLT